MNWAGVSCWAPSESAEAGSGCTSIISASAPAATAAFANEGTRSRCPAGCETSMQMGNSDCLWMTGTAEISSVKRVAVSNVRRPRSHSTTFVLPCWVMYSVAESHSEIVPANPRLNSTIVPVLAVAMPMFFSRLKFWKLRAPT